MQINKMFKSDVISLEDLRTIVRNGEARNVITEGDQLCINFDGEIVPYDVIGIDVDKAADEKIVHTITIQAHELIEEHQFSTKGNTEDNYIKFNKWEDSEIRAYLNSDEYAIRCSKLDEYAIPVIKDNTDGKTTEDKFFLLSASEYDAQSTPYPYYKDKPHRAAKHAKNDFNDYQFTRSAYGNGNFVWYISGSGDISYDLATSALPCAPACVIG